MKYIEPILKGSHPNLVTIPSSNPSQSLVRPLMDINAINKKASAELNQSRRGELGQFMTPDKLAVFMSSFFSQPNKTWHLLEPSAGTGSLIKAFVERAGVLYSGQITAFEIEPSLSVYLHKTIERLTQDIRAKGGCLSSFQHTGDFINETVVKVAHREREYTHAFLNPPYKKIHSKSLHRQKLKAIGQEHVNLYSAFISLALSQLVQGGELVAIVPRSFCNGLYYKPFRNFILGHSALKRIHLFESRNTAFAEDDVLQENIIIHLIRGGEQGHVVVSQSTDQRLHDIREATFDFSEIIKPEDMENFIYVPHLDNDPSIMDSQNITNSLKDIGIEVSTGPVVDFRVREYLREEPEKGAAPLLYPAHFNCKEVEWPRVGRKPNAITITSETVKSLWPRGYYTIVKRFSSKEEKQRIVARVVNPTQLTASEIGLENHLNVFHFHKAGIDGDIAYGLAAFLNSSFVDKYFRSFNGHTQVNATDLKRLRYPSRIALGALGVEARSLKGFSPEEVDVLVSKYL